MNIEAESTKLIGNRYRFIQLLGEGGFGITFIAEDIQRPGNPRCVIKLLKHGNDQIAYRLFRQEAETLEKLGNHDQIPRLLAYLEEEGKIYIVQELIRGNPLSAELHPNCHWEEKAVVEMLLDCLQVLDFVHSFNFIHRDIKPDNIIRRDDGRLVLVDFGTVKGAEPNQKDTVGIVTSGYTPNEQMAGRPQKNSDIYALGMIAIQALTGIAPSDLEQERGEDGEIAWKRHAINLSPGMATILSKMVRFYHKHRYQSVDEVCLDLAQLISNYSVTHISVNEPKPLDPTLVIQPTLTQHSVANQPEPPDPTQPDLNKLIKLINKKLSNSVVNQPKPLDPTQVLQSTPSQPKPLDPTQVIQSTPSQPKPLDPTQVLQSTPSQPKPLDPTQNSKQIENQSKPQKPAISVKILIGVGIVIVLIVLSVITMKLFSPPESPVIIKNPTDPNKVDLCPGPLCPNESK